MRLFAAVLLFICFWFAILNETLAESLGRIDKHCNCNTFTEKGWYQVKSDTYCYLTYTHTMNWSSADELCRQSGLVLPKLSNREAQSNMSVLIKHLNVSYHLGLRRDDRQSGWLWTDGTIAKDVQLGMLGHMHSRIDQFSGKWISSNATEEHPTLCQYICPRSNSKPKSDSDRRSPRLSPLVLPLICIVIICVGLQICYVVMKIITYFRKHKRKSKREKLEKFIPKPLAESGYPVEDIVILPKPNKGLGAWLPKSLSTDEAARQKMYHPVELNAPILPTVGSFGVNSNPSGTNASGTNASGTNASGTDPSRTNQSGTNPDESVASGTLPLETPVPPSKESPKSLSITKSSTTSSTSISLSLRTCLSK